MIKKKNCGKPGAHSLSSNQFPQSPFPEPKSLKVVEIKILGEWYFCRLSTSADIQNPSPVLITFLKDWGFRRVQWPVPRRLTSRSRCIFEGVRKRGRKAIEPNSPTWGALGYRKFPKLSPSKQYKPHQTRNTKNLSEIAPPIISPPRGFVLVEIALNTNTK